MTIAVDTRIINSSTGRYIERLLHYLEKIDHTNKYLVLVRSTELDFYRPVNKNFKIIEANFADYSFGEQLGFALLLQKLKPDLVHFCMPQQPLLFNGPSVTTVHDLNLLRIRSNDMGRIELLAKKLIFRGLLWLVVRRGRQIITPSEFTKKDLIKFSHISSHKINVTYEGGLEITSRPRPIKKYKNMDFILYLGRAEPYKNNRGLIKAHQLLLKSHPKLHLIIAGKKDKLRQADINWVEEQGYKNVEFADFVDDTEAAWLYSNCRAYVFPSFMEGFGLPGLEAMTYGAAVASSNVGSLKEIYQQAAHYFDPQNTQDMARAINDILVNKTLRKKLVEMGEEQCKKYSWQRMAEQTLAIYKKAIKQN